MMMKRRYGRIAAAVAVVVLCLVALVIPASAASSPLPAVDDETLDISTFYQIPLVDGEYLGAVDDVYVWYGVEYTAEGADATIASLGYRAAACTMRDGYYQFQDDSVEVFVYRKQSTESNSPWYCITDETTSLLGTDTLAGNFYNNDGTLKSGTYGQAFSDIAVSYSLWSSTCDAFAVRWEVANDSGAVRKYCYIGLLTHIESNPAADYLSPYARCPFVWYVGLNTSGVSYRLGYEAGTENNDVLQDQIGSLNARIEQLEHDNMMLSESVKLTSESSYNRGYQDGLSASGGDLGIDTSTPWSTAISFVAALFIGLRNLTSPILAVEVAGMSVGTIVGILVAFAVVSIVIVVVLKVKG